MYNDCMSTTLTKNSKSMLSRLLATENIFVIHDKNAKTASFDIMNRVLRLPIFKEMSDEMYDMFVAHEVSHALYTPFTAEDKETLKTKGYLSAALKVCDGDEKQASVAHGYMNVVEDARIERLIKDKFPGLRRDFFIGYRELNERDFFAIKGKDLSMLSFIDRINLYFKIGSCVTIPFSNEELEYVTMVEETRTFDDVIEVTKKIWEYAKNQKVEEFTLDNPVPSNVSGDDDGEGQSMIVRGENGKEGSDTKSEQTNNPNDQVQNGGQWHTKAIMPDECMTQQNFDRKAENLISKDKYGTADYYALPTFNESQAIVDFKTLLSQFDACASSFSAGYSTYMEEAKKFINESNRTVNILAQEFMVKKAAKDHARNGISRTGMIDTVRMTNYKFSDDIFRRIKVTRKGKSHGLVFFVDLSGSMSPVLEDTFKQVIQLVLFCKRVNIPFEVYGFTTRHIHGGEMGDDNTTPYTNYYNRTWKEVKSPYSNPERTAVNPFTLVNLFSHKMNKTQIDLGIRNLLVVSGYYKRNNTNVTIPSIMHLSSTPLLESIAAAMDIVPKFKNENKLDIVNTIFLTDGEPTGACIGTHDTFVYKNQTLFKMNYHDSIEDNFINIFRQVTDMKAICFFLCDYKTSLPHYKVFRGVADADEASYTKKYVKEGWVAAHPRAHSYNEKFILRANNAVENSDLDEVLAEKRTAIGIRNGFIKAMNQNIVSRTMLNRFIDLIATE